MDFLLTLVRCAIGVILLSSGVSKGTPRGRAAFNDAMAAVTGSRRGIVFLVPAVVALEMLLGVAMLLAFPNRPIAATASLIVFVGFTIAVAYRLATGVTITCACFGALARANVGISFFLRNGLLIGACIWIAVGPGLLPAAVAAVISICVTTLGAIVLMASDRVRTLVDQLPPELEPPQVDVHLDEDVFGVTSKPRLIAVLSPGCGGCVRSPEPLRETAASLGALPLVLIDTFAADKQELDELKALVRDAGLDIGTETQCEAIKRDAVITAFPSFLLLSEQGTITHSALGLDQLATIGDQVRQP